MPDANPLNELLGMMASQPRRPEPSAYLRNLANEMVALSVALKEAGMTYSDIQNQIGMQLFHERQTQRNNNGGGCGCDNCKKT